MIHIYIILQHCLYHYPFLPIYILFIIRNQITINRLIFNILAYLLFTNVVIYLILFNLLIQIINLIILKSIPFNFSYPLVIHHYYLNLLFFISYVIFLLKFIMFIITIIITRFIKLI